MAQGLRAGRIEQVMAVLNQCEPAVRHLDFSGQSIDAQGIALLAQALQSHWANTPPNGGVRSLNFSHATVESLQPLLAVLKTGPIASLDFSGTRSEAYHDAQGGALAGLTESDLNDIADIVCRHPSLRELRLNAQPGLGSAGHAARLAAGLHRRAHLSPLGLLSGALQVSGLETLELREAGLSPADFCHLRLPVKACKPGGGAALKSLDLRGNGGMVSPAGDELLSFLDALDRDLSLREMHLPENATPCCLRFIGEWRASGTARDLSWIDRLGLPDNRTLLCLTPLGQADHADLQALQRRLALNRAAPLAAPTTVLSIRAAGYSKEITPPPELMQRIFMHARALASGSAALQ
jgi:hypothetical protein